MPVLFCAAYVYGRLICYGPMTDSIGAQDTESYFETAKEDFPSLEFFEAPRSAALPLLIKLLNPAVEYEITLMSEPYYGSEPSLVIQPGTEKIVQTQTIIAMVCWVCSALLAASCVNGWFSKALISFLILVFSFVPQIADWDSILISESLSFSLMGLMIALLLKIIPYREKPGKSPWVFGFFELVVTILWVFTRDTNVYFVLLTAILLIVISLVWWFRKGSIQAASFILGCCMIGVFLFQQQSFNKSERSLLPFLNNMTANIFPYEERVAFFEKEGMPVTKELLAITGSAEYNEIYQQETFMRWARRNGVKTYKKWLMSMPLWCVTQIWENLDSFFEENEQPFFYGQPNQKPHWASKVGNLFHPLSAGIILIDLLLTLSLGISGFRNHDGNQIRWFCFGVIVFLSSGLMMSISFLGEVRSIWRHVLSSAICFRLLLWMELAAVTQKSAGLTADR